MLARQRRLPPRFTALKKAQQSGANYKRPTAAAAAAKQPHKTHLLKIT